MKNYLIENIVGLDSTPFEVNGEELIAFALEEAALVSDHTIVNNKKARDLVQSYFNKRDKFRHNTRLGNIILKENNLKKEDLIKALAYHEEHGVPLGEAFIKANICTEQQVNDALQKQKDLRSQN